MNLINRKKEKKTTREKNKAQEKKGEEIKERKKT